MKSVCENSVLPDEIVEEILLRLPAKSLMRFQCVSKIWLQKIDSLDFAIRRSASDEDNQILQVTFATNPPFPYHLLLLEDGNRFKGCERPVLESPIDIYESNLISHTAFGFFCFYTRGGVGKAYLCNPIRREVLELPQARVSSDQEYYGMGFDNTTDTYKIVRVTTRRTEIYILGTSSWRKITSVPSSPLHKMSSGVSAYGDMHWVDDDRSFIDCKGMDQCSILSFDFKNEEFKQTPIPDLTCESCDERFEMINLRGCLAIVGLSFENIEIWMMKDYENKEWTREYKIRHSCESIFRELCLYVGAWGRGVVFNAYCSKTSPVAVFDLETNDMLYLQLPKGKDYNRRNYSYTGNILSLKHFGNLIEAEDDRRCHFLETADLAYLRP